MKNPLVFASLFAACLTLGAQDNASTKLPQDPKAILEMATPFYNYDSATAKPFHLRYHYRLLDNQENVSAEGKVEYWWSPGNGSRVSWLKGNNVHSEWRTVDGKTLQSVKGDDITSMEHRLNSAVLFSLPKPQDYESGETSLKLVTINNSGTVNLCVAMVPSKAVGTGFLPREDSQPDGLHGVGTAYCFDSQTSVLVSTLMNHTITNSYSRIQKFLDHNIAGHIDISYVGEKRVEADLEESNEIKADDAAFTPAPDATEPPIHMVTIKRVPITTASGGGINAGITPGAQPHWVDFILTSANTWKQPIEDFTLIVERGKPELEKDQNIVSFCTPQNAPVTKIDANTFQVHLTNFVPKDELRIGFFDVPPPAPASPGQSH